MDCSQDGLHLMADAAKSLPCRKPSHLTNVKLIVSFPWSHMLLFKKVYLTAEVGCSWNGPKWACIDDSNPNEGSELIIFGRLGTDGWFDVVHWLGTENTSCNEVSLFRGCVPVIPRCRGLYSSPKSILIWENWIGCNAAGKHTGCKLKPFLIDNIWNVKHQVNKS